ncbi:hematopoietic progenitor cell antigen CD34-like [Engraulis encrasicolus]|uniref:hematopoietic progenitor cell antigen CD34-like n=1 Tax=Engraulis encrasicolus TaxID=184585 RepID=UPI002FD2B1D6
MRVSARRMNDLWGRMGLALLFSAALLLNGVLCQDDDPAATDAPARGDDVVTDAPDSDPQTPIEISPPTDLPAGDAGDAADTSATAAPDSTGAVDQPADTDATAAPDAAPDAGADTGATAAPAGDADQATQEAPAATPDNREFIVNSQINMIFPDLIVTDAPVVVEEKTEDPEPISVKCVSQHADPILKVELASAPDCETVKAAVEEQICKDKTICKISIVQDGEVLTLAGLTVDENKNEVMQSLSEGELKEKLGVLKTEPVAQQGSNVLVAILVTGLLLAAALIGGYVWLNRRRGNGKGMRLAEDSYPVDEENQGNTLVSVAPLNPPEPQEKPAINGSGGEAPADGVKTQAPAATNGHSTAKTPVADTEL